jgi:hypothetical protein
VPNVFASEARACLDGSRYPMSSFQVSRIFFTFAMN